MGNGSVAAAGAGATAGTSAGAASGSAASTKGAARASAGANGGEAKGRSFGDVLGGKGALVSAIGAVLGEKEGEAGGRFSQMMAPAGALKGASAPFAKGEAAMGHAGAGGHLRADARDEKERERRKDALDPLDPSERHAAQMAPPIVSGVVPSASSAAAPAEVGARASMESLLPGLVKRIAWSGDARKGTVRIELGAGPLEGGTLLVHADDGRVRVHLSAPAGADGEAWKERIEKRLTARGLDVEQVIVE